MRADVNVSVRRPGEPFGTRCEIKNMNSVRFIGQAIDYEAHRQIDLIEDNKPEDLGNLRSTFSNSTVVCVIDTSPPLLGFFQRRRPQ